MRERSHSVEIDEFEFFRDSAMNTSEREGPEKKPYKKRGTRWLFFWENILLPLNLVMGVGWLTIDFQSVSLLMLLLIAATIVGLKHRSLWGWYLNFILLVAVTLSYPFYLHGQKLGDYELYKQAHDVLVNIGEREPGQSVLPPPKFAAEDFFLPFGIAAVIILLPSAIYFGKRKYLFDGSVLPSASIAPQTEPQPIVSAYDAESGTCLACTEVDDVSTKSDAIVPPIVGENSEGRLEVQPHEVQQARVEQSHRFPIPVALALVAFAIAVLCLAPNSKLWTSRYYWHIPVMPTILLWAAAILGIPSGLLLLSYISRFLARDAFLTILWLGIIVIVLISLCPPWVQTVRLPSSNIKGTTPAGYAFLWDPPDSSNRYSGIAIDYPRLLLQIFAVALTTGGLLFTLRACHSKGKSSEP